VKLRGPVHDTSRKSHILVQFFDVFFIMALCFVTLLATMLLRGKVLVGDGSTQGLDLSFRWWSFLVVAVVFVCYIWYMLRHSERELKDIVKHVYDKSDENPSTPESRP
jgi:dolichyl-phosphate-mannose--protein O-mannosyl transferase